MGEDPSWSRFRYRQTCGTRIVMREVRDAIAEILERTAPATVCRKVDAARQKQRGPGALVYDV